MRFLFVVPFLALSACGLIEELPSADGSSFPGGAGGDSSQPPLSVKCAPLSKGSQTGELVPPAPLTSLRVKADGCDPSFAGDVQYSWTAPAAGCYTISTLATRHAAPETLKVTRDTCDGSPVLCSSDNFGYSGPLGPLAQGDRLVIAFTKTEPDAAGDYSLSIDGPFPIGPCARPNQP